MGWIRLTEQLLLGDGVGDGSRDDRQKETGMDRPSIDIYEAHSCCIVLSSIRVDISAVGA